MSAFIALDICCLDKNTAYSTAINRALTAVLFLEPELEALVLHGLQVERYVEGRDTADTAVVSQIIKNYFPNLASEINESALKKDHVLIAKTEKRIIETQERMRNLSIQGIPKLIINTNGTTEIVCSSALYSGEKGLL